jgi:hypothetical protein
LKNGGLVRGTIVSLDPGHQVVITIPGVKEARTIPWAEVADVERGKHAASAAQPSPPIPGYSTPPPAAVPAAAEGPGVVKVHIDTKTPVNLVEVDSHMIMGPYGRLVLSHSTTLCASPCDRVVDARSGQAYYVEGEAIPTSQSFQLGGLSGDVQVKVNGGSRGLRKGGIAGIALGSAGLVAGVALVVVGSILGDHTSDFVCNDDGCGDVNRPNSTGPTMRTAGIVALAGGATLLTGGIIMLVAGRTHAKVEATPKDAPKNASKNATSARAPNYWLGEF